MSFESNPCIYHPTKVAVGTCFRCNRDICLEDRKTHTTGSATTRVTREYCLICFAPRAKLDSKHALIFPLTFSASFLIICLFIFFEENFPLNDFIYILLFEFIFVYASLFYHKSYRKKAIIAQSEADSFIQSLPDKNVLTATKNDMNLELDQSNSSEFSINCFDCGSIINTNDRFCPNCGEDTKDEIKEFLNKP